MITPNICLSCFAVDAWSFHACSSDMCGAWGKVGVSMAPVGVFYDPWLSPVVAWLFGELGCLVAHVFGPAL